MVASHHFHRVDTQELKDLIYQKIGCQRAEMYFNQLNRFLDLKISKAEFAKSCIMMIGRENIPLHNRLLQSILRNACKAKLPPQKARRCEGLGVKVANGYQRNCFQSLYGNSFPQSSRKCRSPVHRDRKVRDRPSPLGPLGKSPSLTCEETVSRLQEQPSGIELRLEDGEEVEQIAGSSAFWSRVPITAPPGVSINTGYAREARFSSNSSAETCQSSGELPDTRTLRSRLQKKLAVQGVEVSLDSSNLLNRSLDMYLKRLIEACTGIARSRYTNPPILGRQLNGQMMPGMSMILPGTHAQRTTQPVRASMLDFRVAMESNPFMLGTDWSTQLEKISYYAFE